MAQLCSAASRGGQPGLAAYACSDISGNAEYSYPSKSLLAWGKKSNKLQHSPSLPSEIRHLWQNVCVLQNAGAPSKGFVCKSQENRIKLLFAESTGPLLLDPRGLCCSPFRRAASAIPSCLPGLFFSGCLLPWQREFASLRAGSRF